MRTIALSGTVCGLVLAISGVSVGSDFDALLQDLSFGDAPSLHQSGTAEVAVQETADTLKPVPNQFVMPSAPPVQVNAPLVALKNPVQTPDLQPIEQEGQVVDFDQVFSSYDTAPSDAALAPISTPAKMVSTKAAAVSIEQPVISQFDGGCDVANQNSCDAVFICRPHVRPNLPTSTMLQYFRSNKCHTHVWDGYNENCGDNHSHLHGTCDCFDASKKKSFFGGKRNDCGSCDGSCDR